MFAVQRQQGSSKGREKGRCGAALFCVFCVSFAESILNRTAHFATPRCISAFQLACYINMTMSSNTDTLKSSALEYAFLVQTCDLPPGVAATSGEKQAELIAETLTELCEPSKTAWSPSIMVLGGRV